jgi:hypothetical protein
MAFHCFGYSIFLYFGSVVIHADKQSTWEAETGGSCFEASLGDIIRPCKKLKKLTSAELGHLFIPDGFL